MSLYHKIRLIVSKFSWWLSFTNKQSIYAKKAYTYKSLDCILKSLEEKKLVLQKEKKDYNDIELFINFLKTLLDER